MDNIDKNADILTILEGYKNYAADYEERKKKEEKQEEARRLEERKVVEENQGVEKRVKKLKRKLNTAQARCMVW